MTRSGDTAFIDCVLTQTLERNPGLQQNFSPRGNFRYHSAIIVTRKTIIVDVFVFSSFSDYSSHTQGHRHTQLRNSVANDIRRALYIMLCGRTVTYSL